MAIPDRTRVLTSQLTGVAAGYAHLKRCTHAEAVAEVAEILASAKTKLGTPTAAELLSQAASFYVSSTGNLGHWWFPPALAFLVDAGADLHRAASIRAALPGEIGQVTAY